MPRNSAIVSSPTPLSALGKAYLIGDGLLHSHDAELNGAEVAYTKNKTITLSEFTPS